MGDPLLAAGIPSFAVQEFQVVGDNADANVGRTATGAVTYALKSGTNQFHGSAFEYNRNTAYDAKNYFRLSLVWTARTSSGSTWADQLGETKPFFTRITMAFDIRTHNWRVHTAFSLPR